MNGLQTLVQEVVTHYRKEGRDFLPWRKTRDPYRILVSEMMLQQTQVERVMPKYRLFVQTFPTVRALAQAKLSDVLAVWSGLGYNRRAKFLHEAAQKIVQEYQGTFPREPEMLEQLPGVGQYTARAIVVFAFDRPEVFIETNIRTVSTHFCFSDVVEKVSDAEILPLVAAALPLAEHEGLSPREWYAALMDYGAYLKRNGIRINSKSKHYAKQSKFSDSNRQLRGAIVRELLQKPATAQALAKRIKRESAAIEKQLVRLEKEGMVRRVRTMYHISR